MQLYQVNKELQDSLIPPSQELVEYTAKLSRQFEELRARVLKLAESFGVPSPTPDEIFSLQAFESLLHNVTEAEKKKAEGEKVRQQALRVLDRVLAITHRDCIDFQPLLECHSQARELRQVVTEVQVSDLHPDIKALAEGQHPFLQLLTLIEYQDELDDDRCTFLQESVAKSLGKPLSVAALRGKLIISADARGRIKHSSLPISPSPHLPLIPRGGHASSLNGGNPRTRLAPEFPISPSPHLPISLSFLSGTSEQNPAALHYLIWQLLCKNKLGLAFHLARCLEIQSPDLQLRLPSWLIRAVVLGRHLRYDVESVEIAKTLVAEFSNSSDSCFVDGEDEWNQAVSLLLAASALRPALLWPNTGASEILHSLRLGEGLNQLHEYCQTIANYGDQLQSLDAIALKKVKEQLARQQALDDLRQRVEDWYSFEAPDRTMNFADATNDCFQQQAHQLKQVVSERQKAVLEELDSFNERNSSVLVMAGICCCRTVVKDIQDCFRSRRSVTNRRA